MCARARVCVCVCVCYKFENYEGVLKMFIIINDQTGSATGWRSLFGAVYPEETEIGIFNNFNQYCYILTVCYLINVNTV